MLLLLTVTKRIQMIGFARNAAMKIIRSESFAISANSQSQVHSSRWDTHLPVIRHNRGIWGAGHHLHTVTVTRRRVAMACLPKAVTECHRRVVTHHPRVVTRHPRVVTRQCLPITAMDTLQEDPRDNTLRHMVVHPPRPGMGLQVSETVPQESQDEQ
mmetsp:Transcript_35174/g.65156  ORF Transcript_35174/g.65156 Transcript_35174/m.65156 type:complete len:157 (-) Transcript_35174:247-717(-)